MAASLPAISARPSSRGQSAARSTAIPSASALADAMTRATCPTGSRAGSAMARWPGPSSSAPPATAATASSTAASSAAAPGRLTESPEPETPLAAQTTNLRARMLQRLYARMLDIAAGPNALTALLIISFVESSFFPIPPDILLIPMILARPRAAWRRGAFRPRFLYRRLDHLAQPAVFPGRGHPVAIRRRRPALHRTPPDAGDEP